MTNSQKAIRDWMELHRSLVQFLRLQPYSPAQVPLLSSNSYSRITILYNLGTCSSIHTTFSSSEVYNDIMMLMYNVVNYIRIIM